MHSINSFYLPERLRPARGITKTMDCPHATENISQDRQIRCMKVDNPDFVAVKSRTSKEEEITVSEKRKREIHIACERKRRASMHENVEILRSLLPMEVSKVDQATILTEAAHYIEELKLKLEELQQKKVELLECMERSEVENDASEEKISVDVRGTECFITVITSSKTTAWSRIMLLLERHHLNISNANLSVHNGECFHSIHAYSQKVAASKVEENLLADTLLEELSSLC